MTPKKRKQLAADMRSAKAISERFRTRAEAAGIVRKTYSRQLDLPDTLNPLRTVRERRLMHRAMQYFEAAHRSGIDVYHLTWCPLEYRISPGSLTPDVVKQIRTIASRRARNIPTKSGRRLIGAVDIAFNPDHSLADGGVWCVHVHALVVVSALKGGKAKKEIKRAFRVAPRVHGQQDIRPRHVRRFKDLAHLLRCTSYISGVLALVDHNPRQNRHRRFREIRQKEFIKSYQMLPPALQCELTQLYAKLGPNGFWVLSGFRRRGERVEPEPAFSSAEAEVLKQHRQQRKATRKGRGWLEKTMDDLRLF